MKREDLKEIHNITHLDNIESIMSKGIYCHNKMKTSPHKSIADIKVQELRAKKVLPNGRPLHDYANLYLNGRNKMMYVLKANHSDMCILRVSTQVLNLPNVVITDRNASSDYVRFYDSPIGLVNIDEKLVFAHSWYYPEDGFQTYIHGSIICSEVLVPDNVLPRYIIGAIVSCTQARTTMLEFMKDQDIIQNPDMFFQ